MPNTIFPDHSPMTDQASPSLSNTASGASDGMDIMYFVRLLMLHKWKIIGFVLLFTTITIFIVRPMAPLYYAETTLMIDTNKTNIVGLQDVFSADTRSRNFIATQNEVIRSQALADKVIERLNLVRHPIYDPRQQEENESLLSLILPKSDESDMTADEIDQFVYRLVSRIFSASLDVSSVGYTQLIKIGYTSTDPQLAADVANTMADVYIESHLEARLDATKRATSWLSGRLTELRENLQSSEERLQAYKESQQLVDVAGVRTLDEAELTQLRENYIAARQNRVDAQALYQQVRGLPTEQLLAIPVILNNSLVQDAIEKKLAADQSVTELSRRYGPKHPAMVAALNEQTRQARDLNVKLVNVVKGLEANYQAALTSERALQAQIDNTQSRLQTVGRKEVKLRELQREVETNRQLYELFLSRGKEADESSRLQESPARVVDEARVPLRPIGPPKNKYIMAAVVFSGGLIVGLIILLDFLKSTVRTSDDVENRLRIPMLGFLPLIKNNKSKNALKIFGTGNDEGGFSEAVRTIRTSLILSSLENPFKVIVVTSSVPDEGKSTVALNMAEALGQMEKVLLIDADMRKPTVAKALGMPSSTVGLSNVIVGKAKVDACLHKVPGMEIDILLSGVVPNNPLELLGSPRFGELLEYLKKRYDRIIIDSAPVHIVSDAKVLSSHADSLLYVIKSDATPLNIVTKGVKTLREVHAPITGAILNQVDLKKSSQYDSYYGVYEKGYEYIADSAKSS